MKEEVKKELNDKIGEDNKNAVSEPEIVKSTVHKRKSLITSRVLFISVLDKIYIIILLLIFLVATINNFTGDISSISYGFWNRIGKEIIIIFGIFIWYLILNWFYKCAAKTMLCLTENEVYKETYVPFHRSEMSIPLNKITGVTTHNWFWIFRAIIIHQYSNLPTIFFTWTNQEFKDKLNELITTEKEKIENEYEDKNIISKDKYKYLKYFAIGFAGVICLIGVVRFFNFVFSSEMRMAGTYTYSGEEIRLNKDGTCDINDIIDERVTECIWSYDEDDKEVEIEYEYYYYSYYGYSYTRTDSLNLKYNSSKKVLEYDGDAYKK